MILKSIRKDRMNSLLFTNIPSRNVFETIETPLIWITINCFIVDPQEKEYRKDRILGSAMELL